MLSNVLLKRSGDFLLAGLAIAGEQFFDHTGRKLMIGRLFGVPCGEIGDADHFVLRLSFQCEA